MSVKAIRAGRAEVEVGVKDRLKKGLNSARKRLAAFASTANQFGKGLAGAALASGSLFIVPIQAASRLEETMNKFNVVFGKNSQQVKAWGDQFGKEVGRSEEQIASFLAGTQDLFVPLGFEAGAAEGMSKQVTKLAVDLASFNNMADADTLRDLHAALTGSGEVMKKYGVIVSEAAVKQQLLNDGIDPKKATDQQKVMARLNIIMAGTTAAQGDAIRSSGSFANQFKKLRAEFDNTMAALGSALLPTITKLLSLLNGGVQTVAEWIKENKELVATIGKGVGVFALVTGVAGGLLLAFGGVASVLAFIVSGISTLITVGGTLAAVFGAILSPAGLLTAAIVGGAVAFLRYTATGKAVLEWFRTNFAKLKEIVTKTLGGVGNALKSGKLKLAAKIAFAGIKVAAAEALKGLLSLFGVSLQEMARGLAKLYKNLRQFYAQFNRLKAEAVGAASGLLKGPLGEGLVMSRLSKSQQEFLRKHPKVLGRAVDQMVSGMRDQANKGLADAANINVDALADEIGKAFDPAEHRKELERLSAEAAAAAKKADEEFKETSFSDIGDIPDPGETVGKINAKLQAGTFSAAAAKRFSGLDRKAEAEKAQIMLQKDFKRFWNHVRTRADGGLFS